METVMMISVALGIIWGIWDVKTKPERERLAKKREEELEERLREEEEEEAKELRELENKIINLLKEKNKKISVSDINAFIKHTNLEETKMLCESLYQIGKINFAGNGRYFILNGTNKESISLNEDQSEFDVEKELEKYKSMLDKGLITQEQYDTKLRELTGL